MKHLRLAVVATVAACASAAGAAETVHDPAANLHEHGATRGPVAGLYSAADLQFLTHMIVHHEQALQLCGLVEARSSRDAFRRFARLLNDAQQSEIDQMKGLLQQAQARGVAIPDAHLQGDPPMPGMLSRAQMAEIAQARGTVFEGLWLEGMILHHQGAIDMALAQQEAQFRNRNQPFGLDTLVDEMLAVQRGEIGKMREWLGEWRGR